MKFTLNNFKWSLDSAPISITTHSVPSHASNLSKDGNDVQFNGEIPTMNCIIEKMEFEFSVKDLIQATTINTANDENEKDSIRKLKSLVADLKGIVRASRNSAIESNPIVKTYQNSEKKEEIEEEAEKEPLW
jgi:hypothetical protein